MRRNKIIIVFGGLLAIASIAMTDVPVKIPGIDLSVAKFKTDSRLFAEQTRMLRHAIENIKEGDSASVATAKMQLAQCRLHYKSIEFFLTYFFPAAAIAFNMPAKTEVEEKEMELTEPIGLQVIESLLHENNVASHKAELLQQMEVITSSAEDLNSLLHNFKGNDKQLLESVRLELIRIMVLGISGYDAPLLKTGIPESYAALISINATLQPLLGQSAGGDSLSSLLDQSLSYLAKSPNFDGFDRLKFLTDFALPLQECLGKWIKQSGLEINTVAALNYDAKNLFSSDQLVPASFSPFSPDDNPMVIHLGQALFFERALSGNNVRSCASCHKPDLYYSDGLPKSKAFNENSSLERNAPSIMYASFQYGQGWDGRIPGLEAQVIKVLSSPEEMNADDKVIVRRLRKSEKYRDLFAEAFGGTDDAISVQNIARSIAAFVRTCNSFTTAFDKYVGGDRNAMSESAQRGFNLFMGKAQCGTCHFAPLFNGLTPPMYDLSEVEVIGVPATELLDSTSYDGDRGRYNLYPLKVYDKAFKTPGLRNVAKTAPYMHNGSFTSLKQVVQFYNRGGSEGIGLSLPNQTLSSRPLNLSEQEVADIVSFLESLTDTLPQNSNPTIYLLKTKGR